MGCVFMGFPGGSDSKASVYNEEYPGSIPGSGRSPGEENGNPLQYFCLENPMDGGAWWTTLHGVVKSRTQLSDFTFTLCVYIFVPVSYIYSWRIASICRAIETEVLNIYAWKRACSFSF